MIKRRIHRTLILTGTALLIAVLAGIAGAGQTLNLLTTPMGMANYVISVSQGQLITKKTGIQVIVQPTQGALVMPGLLEAGDGQLATLTSIWSHWAYSGTGEYKKPFRFIRVLQSGNDTFFSLVTRQETGIKTIEDLKGKRVTIDVISLLPKILMEVELQAYGLNPAKDITILKAEDTPTGLRDLLQGRTDAVCCSLGGSKMAEYATKMKMVVIPFAMDKASSLQKSLPAMALKTTPNNLSGVAPGIPAASTPMLLIGRADIADDTAYQIVKTLIENYQELKAVNPVMADWKPEAAVNALPIPYHNGAIKYYKEKNFWNAKMDQHQERLGK